MAYFTASDEIRTLKYLGYSPNDVVSLRVYQRTAYNWFGDAIVTETQSILKSLDELQVLENSYATDASSSLIRADVLEWNPQGRQANLDKRRQTLVNQLSSIFDMPVKSRMCGSTPLGRA